MVSGLSPSPPSADAEPALHQVPAASGEQVAADRAAQESHKDREGGAGGRPAGGGRGQAGDKGHH